MGLVSEKPNGTIMRVDPSLGGMDKQPRYICLVIKTDDYDAPPVGPSPWFEGTILDGPEKGQHNCWSYHWVIAYGAPGKGIFA